MNNILGDIGALDLISLYEIYRSRNKEQIADEFTNSLIQALAYEIQKLHEENDIIIKQNEYIIDYIRRKL